MNIGARVQLYVATINSVPRFVPGTVERTTPGHPDRVDIVGDDGDIYPNVHPMNVHTIVTEEQ